MAVRISSRAGLNYRMTEFQAVLGFYQLARIDDIIENNYCRRNSTTQLWQKLPSIKTPPNIWQ